MSKLCDYSKFDHLEDSDEEHEPTESRSQSTQTIGTTSQSPRGYNEKDPKTGRYVYYYDSRKIYQWEQSLDTITLYLDPPPNCQAKDLDIIIATNHIKVGLRGADTYFIDESLFSCIDTSESCWFLDPQDSTLQLVLYKQRRGETWECALQGRDTTINPLLQRELQQQLLLERFQEENPGMDFRSAAFNGSIPDPRTFMGGIGYE
jgi:CS domain